MGFFDRFDQKILGNGTSVFSRIWHIILLFIILVFLDFFTGFPIGILQLNQLEQLEKIDILENSHNISALQKAKLNVEKEEILNRYYFLSDLRRLFSSLISDGIINRNTTIDTINSAIKSSTYSISNFLCSNFAYTLSLSLSWVIMLLFYIWYIFDTKTLKNDLIDISNITVLIVIAYYILRFIPKFESCTINHLSCFGINILITIVYFALVKKERNNDNLREP